MFSGKEFTDYDFLNWCLSKGLNSLRIIWKNKEDNILELNEKALVFIYSYDIFVYLCQDGFPLGICLDVNKDVKEAYKLSLKLPTPTFVIVAREDKENKEVLSFFWDIEDRLSEQDYEQISNSLREKFPNLASKFRPPNSWVGYSNSQIVWLKVGESYSKDSFLQLLNSLPEKEEKEKEEEIPTKCQLIENLYSFSFSELKDFALEFLSYDAIINNKEHIFQRKCIDSKIHPLPYLQKALFNLQNNQDNIPSCRIIASLSKDELEDLFGSKFDSHPCENCYFNFSLRKPFYQFKKLTIPKGYIQENGIIREKKTETTIAYDFDVDSILEIKENRSLSTKIVARKGRELQYIDFASGKEILSSFKTPSVKKFREFIAEFISKNKHLIIHQKGYSGYDFETKTWNILNLHYTEPRISETLDISKKGKQEDFISILKDIVSLMTENKDFYLAIPLCGALNFLEKPSDPAPAYLISGLPETGKTLRLSLINFLVRYPKPLDFTTISEAFIKSQLPKIKAFICIDNVSDSKRKYAERLTILLNLNEISSSYIPLILASSKIKNYNHKSILHLKIEEKNDELLEEYSKILQKILHLPCYGHLYKISNDLCQIKHLSKLPFEINPNLFSFQSNYVAFKSSLEWWHSLCSYLDVKFNITQEDIMNFINENFSTQKEYILLSLLDHIHQKFLKGKSSVYWREIKQELGINDDIFKILLCNEWSYHDNGFGKKYPVLRITKNSPLYQLWKGIPIQETELISKILENKEMIESQTDYKFKVKEKEIKSLISNFINLFTNLSESFH